MSTFREFLNESTNININTVPEKNFINGIKKIKELLFEDEEQLSFVCFNSHSSAPKVDYDNMDFTVGMVGKRVKLIIRISNVVFEDNGEIIKHDELFYTGTKFEDIKLYKKKTDFGKMYSQDNLLNELQVTINNTNIKYLKDLTNTVTFNSSLHKLFKDNFDNVSVYMKDIKSVKYGFAQNTNKLTRLFIFPVAVYKNGEEIESFYVEVNDTGKVSEIS